MSNRQAPSRPWFSFASLTRLAPTPTPTPAPAPQPRQSLARPTLRPAPQPPVTTPPVPARNAVAPASGATTAQVPKESVRTAPNTSTSVPIPRTNAPPTASYPNSTEQKPQPSKKVSAPPASTTASYATARKEVSTTAPPPANITTTAVMARSVSPKSSQEFVKPASSNRLSQHPKIKAVDEEPKIPAVSEEKNVISQRTVDKPKAHNNNETYNSRGVFYEKQELAKANEVKENAKGYVVKNSGFEDVDHGMRVLTIAGENRGAVMEVHPAKKHGLGPGHPSFLYNKKNDINSNGSESESSNNGSSNEYGSSNSKKKSNKANKMRSLPVRAFINSNVQGINNSVVSDTSFNHHDPGIHLGLTKKPSNDGFHIKGGSKN